MQRETFLAVVERARGLRKDGDRYAVKEDHEVAVYVGQPGRAAAVEHVLAIALCDTHVEIEARDRGTFYVAYDAVNALLVNARKERKGNTGVGF